MSELRAALLILGVLFIVSLAWWERRRRHHAGGPPEAQRRAPPESGAELSAAPGHEPSFTLPPMRARALPPPEDLPVVPVLDSAPAPDPAAAEPAAAPDASGAESTAARAPEAAGAGPQAPAALPEEVLPRLPASPAPVVDWPPDARRRVVTLRLVAPRPELIAGRSLRQALAAEGFVLGRFAIFHKPDEEQRAVLSAASLTRPGTFDGDTMDSQHYGGLSLFAVLPGPKPPAQAFDELVSTARNLNERLCGVLQDEQGSPLTPARIALLRERLGAGAPA